MKKIYITLLLISTYIVNAQVIYNETFDNFILGNLGTDSDGLIPGQGDWLTFGETQISKNNNLFTIENEQGRGKALKLKSEIMPNVYGNVIKKNINQLINNRRSGYNVIKFEIDYYTGPKGEIKPPTGAGNVLLFNSSNSYRYLFAIRFSYSGNFYAYTDSGGAYHNRITFNNNNDVFPFDTWLKIILYLDYNNKKIYTEIPYFNKVVKVDFLNLATSNNLFEDFKPQNVQLYFRTIEVIDDKKVYVKVDNIKITALKDIPTYLSVNEVLNEKFNIFPNPVNDVVNITNNDNIKINKIKIYNENGKFVKEENYNTENNIQLNIENLQSGIYMLDLETDHGSATKKIIKKLKETPRYFRGVFVLFRTTTAFAFLCYNW